MNLNIIKTYESNEMGYENETRIQSKLCKEFILCKSKPNHLFQTIGYC